MHYEIVLSPDAITDLRKLDARDRAMVRDALEVHLRHEPTKLSKSRIKRLRGLAHPQFRLRIGDLRVFYDVSGTEVQVLAVIAKAKTEEWLQQAGRSEDEEGSSL
jgi:mRNA-degrading endonuclease RelE of RelBE toxin-antitoxin system